MRKGNKREGERGRAEERERGEVPQEGEVGIG